MPNLKRMLRILRSEWTALGKRCKRRNCLFQRIEPAQAHLANLFRNQPFENREGVILSFQRRLNPEGPVSGGLRRASRRPRASGLHILESAPDPLNRLVKIAPLLVQAVRERLIKGRRRVLSVTPGVIIPTAPSVRR